MAQRRQQRSRVLYGVELDEVVGRHTSGRVQDAGAPRVSALRRPILSVRRAPELASTRPAHGAHDMRDVGMTNLGDVERANSTSNGAHRQVCVPPTCSCPRRVP